MFRDRYGLALTCSSQAAADGYEEGLLCALTLDRSGIAALEAATALDTEFALAQCLLARQHMIHGAAPSMYDRLAAAERHAPGASDRERSALAVGIAALRFAPDALELATSHLREYPRDVFVLMQLVGPFGLLAFSGLRDWRERNLALVEELEPQFPAGDWWLAAALGFSYAETGALAAAEKHAERAWRTDENGTTGHALAHVHVEQAATAAGTAFLDEWIRKYSAVSDMDHHMRWHRALLRLAEHGAEGLLDLFEAELALPADGTPPLDVVSDNASLLWRLELHDVDVPAVFWERLAEFAAERFPDLGFAFAGLHRAMAAAAVGGRQRAAFAAALDGQDASLLKACEAGFSAFADGRYGDAAAALEPALDASLLIGGSNPQRDVVRQTYAEAARRRPA